MYMDVDGCGWMWMDVDGCGWPVAPQYGDSVATSLKNVQNLPKSSKLRQNSV